MTLLLWYLGCLALGAVAGSHSGHWGGLALVIVGVPVYFMLPPRFRTTITERHLAIGAAIAFIMAASFYPLMEALGMLGP